MLDRPVQATGEGNAVIEIKIFPLHPTEPAMLSESFAHPFQALAYVKMWLGLGHCRIEPDPKQDALMALDLPELMEVEL
jgi:hypothetical protein